MDIFGWARTKKLLFTTKSLNLGDMMNHQVIIFSWQKGSLPLKSMKTIKLGSKNSNKPNSFILAKSNLISTFVWLLSTEQFESLKRKASMMKSSSQPLFMVLMSLMKPMKKYLM